MRAIVRRFSVFVRVWLALSLLGGSGSGLGALWSDLARAPMTDVIESVGPALGRLGAAVSLASLGVVAAGTDAILAASPTPPPRSIPAKAPKRASRASSPASSNGVPWAWGENNHGQLGKGTANNSSIPVVSTAPSGTSSLAAGYEFALAARGSDGTVWAWGDDSSGQLGQSSYSGFNSVPAQVPGLPNPIVQVAAGNVHSMALDSSGNVWTWGGNGCGQLGPQVPMSTSSSSTPSKVTGLPTIVAVAAGGGNSFALDGSGTLWGWGDESSGQLANGVWGGSRCTNQPVNTFSNVRAMAVGSGAWVVAIKNDGTVWA